MYTKLHDGALQKKIPNTNTGWKCSSIDKGEKCKSKITRSNQT
jgi:hypothetical protein